MHKTIYKPEEEHQIVSDIAQEPIIAEEQWLGTLQTSPRTCCDRQKSLFLGWVIFIPTAAKSCISVRQKAWNAIRNSGDVRGGGFEAVLRTLREVTDIKELHANYRQFTDWVHWSPQQRQVRQLLLCQGGYLFHSSGDSGQPCQKGKPWYVWKKSRIIGKASNSQHSKRYRAAPRRYCTVSLIKLLSYPARLIWQELLFIVRFSGRSAVDAVLSEAFIYRLFTGSFNRFSS